MNAPPDDRRLTGRWFDAKPAKHRAEAAALHAAREDGRRQGFINKPIDPILTVTIAIDRNGNVYEDTQTHGSKWADVYRAFHAIKAEIERQIAERKNCPFIPTKSALPLPGDAPTAAAAPSTPRGPAPTGTAAAAPDPDREGER